MLSNPLFSTDLSGSSDVTLEKIYSQPLIGNGTFGYVFKISADRVLKIPRAYPQEDETTAYLNSVNSENLKNEGNIYRRLGVYEGILHCFEVLDESIELSFANEGTLLSYIQNNPPPSKKFRSAWIQSLADTFSYAHSRRVVVQDISLQNILVHNKTLKLMDFGQSFLLPLATDMERFCVNGTTLEIEVLHLGCIFYSIAAWDAFKYYYFDLGRWPRSDELPNTNGIIGEKVIKKCWARGYSSMEEVRIDVSTLLA